MSIESVMATVAQAVQRAMDEAADESVTAIKGSIDTPYPDASKPLTPPHSRTGNLREGVEQKTGAGEGDALTTIFSNRAEGNPLVPIFLEHGTRGRQKQVSSGEEPRKREHGSRGMAPRPYMGPAMHPAGQLAKQRVAESLREKFRSE